MGSREPQQLSVGPAAGFAVTLVCASANTQDTLLSAGRERDNHAAAPVTRRGEVTAALRTHKPMILSQLQLAPRGGPTQLPVESLPTRGV